MLYTNETTMYAVAKVNDHDRMMVTIAPNETNMDIDEIVCFQETHFAAVRFIMNYGTICAKWDWQVLQNNPFFVP